MDYCACRQVPHDEGKALSQVWNNYNYQIVGLSASRYNRIF